ncbi:CBS domain-containing protein [Merismopedia glauca]|uniref:CBS domain-containing protein n=1 Tax=Merismopedia glauca CCAP 1448/3 TaxID=1296344 RepID=A0A2T1C698_9CYAN|nr:CBS domain-containing protein [Merismopedia glauca]PSB03657.1 hypothetical protein C7B64_07435 [Merismopedia glauca CCAP 1448/3]
MRIAADIMTKNVVTVRGSATVAEAVQIMKDKQLRALIVERRHQDDPYGIVSETDIIYKVAAYGKDPQEIRVYEIMTKPCIVVNPELGVEYVARLFANTKIRRAPVIDGELLGIVSVSDLLHKSDVVEKPRKIDLEDRIDAAIETARRVSAEKGDTSQEARVAWEEVEELQMEAADRRSRSRSKLTSLQAYCAENPDADECRIYED